MNNPQVLILNYGGVSCQTRDESKLSLIIGSIFPRADIIQRKSSASLAFESLQPDIIFCRPPSLKKLPKIVNTLRERWLGVPIVGLFCQDRETQCAATSDLLTCLDDFLILPFQQLDVYLRIKRLLHFSNKPTESARSGTNFRVNGLVGQSREFQKVIEKIPVIASSDVPVLILGETGTGKELVARAIHYNSVRTSLPFVPVNCGALPDQLFENELFGHAKGAFTDASSERKGLLQEAEGGTLFLDEVDSLSPAAQIKLLRFAQEKEYRSLGSSQSLSANVRILAATNRNLGDLVQKTHFREDLYYRINVLSLFLPPLRDRSEDILVLAKHFLNRATRKIDREILQLSSEAQGKMLAYDWPGNVREVEAAIQRAITFNVSGTIQAEEIDIPSQKHSGLLTECALRKAKSLIVGQFERSYLTKVLATYEGNVSQAAVAAGKERRSFQRLLKKHGLNRTTFSGKS